MKPGFTAILLIALLSSSSSLLLQLAGAQEQQPVPDAPTPQTPKSLATDAAGPITPGKGAGETQSGPDSSSTSPAQAAPSSQPPGTQGKDTVQTAAPELPAAGEGVEKASTIIRRNVTAVEVPVTVKDSKGKLVAGLTWRDFKVYENDTRYPISFFTTDSFPLSVAFVIDQSLTSDVMTKVNNSLGAIQGALTPYDEVAVFTYGHLTQERTGFTGAQTARLPAVLALAKATGTEILAPINEGPFSSACSVTQNGNCVDPNVQRGGSAGGSGSWIPNEKEIHTLNDAILAAAKELSNRPQGRRRVIFVISDGKEAGSKATYKEVLRYLETNKIAVYGTLVGDSARWGEGYISRFHLPFMMNDNLLAKYILATGGSPHFENGVNGIEKSYAEIAEEARNQYTLVYYSHQPPIDGRFRKIEVRLERPGFEVSAKQGYYPSAQDSR
ncbi:MAG: VWA domain-containing protein [Terracidiphilus sp.]